MCPGWIPKFKCGDAVVSTDERFGSEPRVGRVAGIPVDPVRCFRKVIMVDYPECRMVVGEENLSPISEYVILWDGRC